MGPGPGDGAAGIGPGGRGRSRRGAHERSASFPASRDRYAGLTGPAVKGSRQGSIAPSRRASDPRAAAMLAAGCPVREPSAAPAGRPPARRGAGACLGRLPGGGSDPGRRPHPLVRGASAAGHSRPMATASPIASNWSSTSRVRPRSASTCSAGTGRPVAALLPAPASTLPAGPDTDRRGTGSACLTGRTASGRPRRRPAGASAARSTSRGSRRLPYPVNPGSLLVFLDPGHGADAPGRRRGPPPGRQAGPRGDAEPRHRPPIGGHAARRRGARLDVPDNRCPCERRTGRPQRRSPRRRRRRLPRPHRRRQPRSRRPVHLDPQQLDPRRPRPDRGVLLRCRLHVPAAEPRARGRHPGRARRRPDAAPDRVVAAHGRRPEHPGRDPQPDRRRRPVPVGDVRARPPLLSPRPLPRHVPAAGAPDAGGAHRIARTESPDRARDARQLDDPVAARRRVLRRDRPLAREPAARAAARPGRGRVTRHGAVGRRNAGPGARHEQRDGRDPGAERDRRGDRRQEESLRRLDERRNHDRARVPARSVGARPEHRLTVSSTPDDRRRWRSGRWTRSSAASARPRGACPSCSWRSPSAADAGRQASIDSWAAGERVQRSSTSETTSPPCSAT